MIVNTVDPGDDRLLAPEFNSHVHAFVSAVGNNVYPTACRPPEMWCLIDKRLKGWLWESEYEAAESRDIAKTNDADEKKPKNVRAHLNRWHYTSIL